MNLDLNFRWLDEDTDKIRLEGSTRMAAILIDSLTPVVKRIITKARKLPQYNEMANVNITNWIIEHGNDRDAHYLMIYTELIDVFDFPDLAKANEGY